MDIYRIEIRKDDKDKRQTLTNSLETAICGSGSRVTAGTYTVTVTREPVRYVIRMGEVMAINEAGYRRWLRAVADGKATSADLKDFGAVSVALGETLTDITPEDARDLLRSKA